ncbi:MAG: right-handed parallel beta-helix repeat-containing protein [Gemmataceae bacterium]
MSSIREFGVKADGQTDDSAALNHMVLKGDGDIVLPRGNYLLTKPIYVPLEKTGRLRFSGDGGLAKLIMAGPGPAIHLVGSHRKSANPADFADSVWLQERMPTVDGLEIEGRHAQADGIRIEGVMQPTLTRVLVRRCRFGFHLANRARNVLIADCHLYHNEQIGIFLDRINLHQINIHGCHISYAKRGGIRVEGSEIRNIQVCSNDIEYNYDANAETSADILYDCREGTIREGTIVGNNIQAVNSPGGANVRLLGVGRDNPNAVGLLAITGNLLGSQETNVHLQACRGVVVTGNSLYSGFRQAVLIEDAEHVVFGPNSIDHNPQYRGKSTDQVVVRNSRNINLAGLVQQHTRAPLAEVQASFDLEGCENVNVTGCQLIDARQRGIFLRGCSVVRVADCTVRGADLKASIEADAACRHLMVTNNFLTRGTGGDLVLPAKAGTSSGNITLE